VCTAGIYPFLLECKSVAHLEPIRFLYECCQYILQIDQVNEISFNYLPCHPLYKLIPIDLLPIDMTLHRLWNSWISNAVQWRSKLASGWRTLFVLSARSSVKTLTRVVLAQYQGHRNQSWLSRIRISCDIVCLCADNTRCAEAETDFDHDCIRLEVWATMMDRLLASRWEIAVCKHIANAELKRFISM
jgi:hypothetical protein